MFLHKLYSEPNGLFDTVEFKNGINFIFAKKSETLDTKDSLNGVGKSLLINFLDFALLSSETKHIKSAKKNNDISSYYIVLEFYIKTELFIIKRSLKDINKNLFLGKPENLIKYDSIAVAKEVLCDYIFLNSDYNGTYYNTWLRKLIPFFIKKQETKSKLTFADPILYSSTKEVEVVSYHLFLLNIDNHLFWENYLLVEQLKIKKILLKEIKKFVNVNYNLSDISAAENSIQRLKNEVEGYEEAITKFKLADQYKDIENQCNTLTTKIKELLLQNIGDNKKIKSYKDSYNLNDKINVDKVVKQYKEFSLVLSDIVKKTLKEAIIFRKHLSESRKQFLQSEIESIEKDVSKREIDINHLEKERANLLSFLHAKEAIKELSDAYFFINEKRKSLTELEGRTLLYRDVEEFIADKNSKLSIIFADIVLFIKEHQLDFSKFRDIFFELYNALYPESKSENFGFTFSSNFQKDSKVDIEVFLPSDISFGKNRARTLIYDLSVLFSIVKNNINAPKFLVHDGIFDGMDKAQFICLYEYLSKLSAQGLKFQYILSINEEGTLSDNFGDFDKVTPQKIELEAVSVLTPSRKLLKVTWD